MRKSPLLIACTLYTIAIGLWLLLRLIFFDRLWWLALVNTMALYLFVPLPLLLLLGLGQRNWRSITVLSLPIVALALLYGGRFTPQALPATANLTVMTFNVLYSNLDDGAIEQSILASGADVVGLQEYTPRHAAALPPLLRSKYPYHAEFSTAGGTGVGLLSRYPIEQSNPFPLPPRDLALHTVLRVGDRRLHLVIVHLAPNHLLNGSLAKLPRSTTRYYATKAAEVEFITQEVQSVQEPLLIVCDCNFTDTSQAYANLHQQFHDSFDEVGWSFGHTFPTFAPVPLVRIDYIWHSDRLQAKTALIGRHGGSDHLPVVAELSW